MNLQKEIIAKFNRQFPNATLKEVSKKTGIQITRVFRIINGYEMKVSEYERFYQVLTQDQNRDSCEHLDLYLKYLKTLSHHKKKALEEKYSQKILLDSLSIPHYVLNSTLTNNEMGVENA
tara:strand:- start:94461 stop:94820 length:360 start_codon:yes stop_codon:yes gene_type:complete